jgi:hypothetical protein
MSHRLGGGNHVVYAASHFVAALHQHDNDRLVRFNALIIHASTIT